MFLDMLLDLPILHKPENPEPQPDVTVPEKVSVMKLAALMGELLLRNGGEIYRVQDTLNRIIDACGFPNHSVYVIANGIFITIDEGEPDACSSVRHIPSTSVNLERIAMLNQISRDLCGGRIGRREAYRKLLELSGPAPEIRPSMALASAFGAAGFGVLFGGTFLDGCCSFVIGFGLQYVLYALSDRGVSRFTSNIIAAFYATLASVLCIMSGLPLHFSSIVIGAVLPLVPGYPFTTAIRDLFNSDYLSGLIHLLDALILAFCIAAGVGFGIRLVTWLGGIQYLGI